MTPLFEQHSSQFVIEMDGLTATNAGNDTLDGTNDLIINSEIRGMAGSDTFTNLALRFNREWQRR